jgi:hypothetical protein
MADVTKEIALKVGLQDNTASGASAIEKNLEELRKKLLELAAAGKQNTDEFKKTEQQIVSLGKQVAALPKTAELSVDVNVDNADLKKLQDIPTGETVRVGVEVDASQLSELSAVPEQITVPVSAKVNDTEYQDFRKEVAEPLPPLPSIAPKDSDVVKVKSAKAELRAMREELLNMSRAGLEGTQAFNDLQLAAGQLQDEISDTGARIKALASDTRNIDTFVGAIQGITAGFQIAQGAAALFGDENEDLQKALLKVQGAMALANGVQQVANLLQKESAVMMGINTLATKTYAAVVGDATEKTRIFRIALAGLGLAGIVVILGLISEALGLFSQKTKDATDSQKDFKRSLEDTAGTLEYYERKLKANGATEADLAKLRRQTLLNEKAELERKLKEDVARFGVKNDKYQNRLRQELDLLNIKIKEESQIIDADAKQRADKKAQEQKQQTDKSTQTANELLAIQKKYQDQLALLNADGLRRELLAIDQKYEADLAKLKKHGKDTADLEAVIAAEKLQKEKEFGIQLMTVRQEDADKQEQDDIARMQRDAALRAKKVAAEIAMAEEIKRIEKTVAEYRKEVTDDSITAIGQILSAFGSENKGLALAGLAIEKGAAIANVIINLQKEMAANAALAAANPANIATAGAAGIAQAKALNTLAKVRAGLRIAAITAAGIQAGKSIMGGGDSVGGGGGGGMMPTGTGGGATPAPPVFSNPNVTDLSGFGGGQGQGMQPMRAYVVERDIQQTTSRVRRLSEFATLG